MERTGPSPVSAYSERAPAPAGAGERPDADRLRAMLDATPQLMWLVEPDGTLVEANRAALAFGGLRREDVVGKGFWESPWWAGAARARLQEAVRRAAQGVLVRYETDVQGAGGRVGTLDFAIQPAHDGTAHDGTAHDGTERARLHAEGHLITEAVQARQLQESLIAARIGTWEIDLRTDAVRRSASSDLVFGFEPDGRPRDLAEYLARIHPDDVPDALEAIRRAAEEQSEQFVEFRVLSPDGSVRWAAARGTAVLDERGEPDHLVGAILDVTQQRASEQAHREREVRLALALDAGQFATWDWFVREDRVVWSDQMYLLFGYDIGAVEPSYELWASHIHPDDRPGVEQALQRSMEGEERYAVEFRILPAGGGERWIEARGRFHYDESGAPYHLTGVVGDVTERVRTAAALREQAQALTTLNRINTALAGELDLDEVVQAATDAATALAAARFGAFFYNVHDEAGESYTLYTISGVPREAFEQFPMPRNTHVFGPTFRGEGVVRSDDITQDPRYGQNAPYQGMPEGHLPVRSYLAVPVVSRSGEVHGGLFLGHEEPGVFTEQAEHLVAGIAAQAAVAIDNARLYEAAQREIAERKEAEQALAEVTAASERQRRFYEAIISSTPDLVYVFDLDYRFTFANEALLTMWGRTREESLGKRLLEVGYEPWHAEMHEREIDQIVATKQAVRGEVPFQHATLGRRVYDYILVPVLNAEGEVEAVAGTTRDVTERKEAEQALLASEERFRRLVLSLPAAVYTTDREGRVTLFNEQAAALWGRRPEIGEDRWCGSWRIYQPDGTPLPLDACPMAVALREERSVRGQEIIVERPDGTRSHVLPHPEPLRDASGAVVGAVNMLVDITELKHADRDRALLAAIVESSDDAIISMTLDGVITSWNAGAERLLGYPAAEAVGRSILLVVPPERHDEEGLILDRIRRGEHVEHFETVRLAADGRALDVSLSLSPIRDGDGPVVGASKVMRDISATKRAEAALRASEARFRHFAEAIPDIAYILSGDETGRDTEYLNPQWYAYTGLPEGMSYAEAAPRLVHPDDLPGVRQAWAEAAAAREPMELEIRLRRHDGAYRWFLTRVVPVLDADGRVARWFGTSTDIHAQKAAEAELAERVTERTAELARSNEALDQFAYVASHDLKAPLRAIDNLAAWIAQDAGPALPEESRRHLGLLQGRVQRMEQLLSDLLAYSRTGREEGASEEVDTAALVREVVEMIAPPPEVEVVVEALPTLVTPRAPLAMVFRNLIDNAVKHREGASVRVRVAADTSGSGDFVTFSVEDDGPGIPARHHERIFGLFQTLQPRDEVEGSGMGLAVVKKAIESGGGSIRVDSVPGQGAAFTFTWPARVSAGSRRR